eukprot:scaffold25496_cov130-Isochrysis_galbana.AAC.6
MPRDGSRGVAECMMAGATTSPQQSVPRLSPFARRAPRCSARSTSTSWRGSETAVIRPLPQPLHCVLHHGAQVWPCLLLLLLRDWPTLSGVASLRHLVREELARILQLDLKGGTRVVKAGEGCGGGVSRRSRIAQPPVEPALARAPYARRDGERREVTDPPPAPQPTNIAPAP